MQETCPNRRKEELTSPIAPGNSRAQVAATGNPIQINSEKGKGETNFPDTEGAKTQFQSMKVMVPFEQTDQTTVEETHVTPLLRKDREARRQGGGRRYAELRCVGHRPGRGPGKRLRPINGKLK
jgi:hypothetical protein